MRVLISGGGIAGPSLALLLARAGGHKVTILERAPKVLPYGQNIDIQGTARSILAKMGVREQILAHNTTEKGTRLIDPQGRPFAPFPLSEGKANSGTSEYEILRGDFMKVMWEATRDQPDIEWRFDTTVGRVLANDERQVKVEMSDGVEESYDLLVACDGQWSRLRKQTFPPESVRAVDIGIYGIYWTVPRVASDISWWSLYLAGKNRVVTVRPDAYGTMRVAITCRPAAEADKEKWRSVSRADRASQERLIREVFSGAGWETDRFLGELSNTPDYYFHDLKQIKMDRWSQGRIVCLGDTAWAPTPLTGMGTSLAVLGAYVLAGEICELAPGAKPHAALEGYEAKFRKFVEETQRITPFVPWLVHGNTYRRYVVQSFAAAMSYALRLPWIADWIGGGDPDKEDFKLPSYPKIESVVNKQ